MPTIGRERKLLTRTQQACMQSIQATQTREKERKRKNNRAQLQKRADQSKLKSNAHLIIVSFRNRLKHPLLHNRVAKSQTDRRLEYGRAEFQGGCVKVAAISGIGNAAVPWSVAFASMYYRSSRGCHFPLPVVSRKSVGSVVEVVSKERGMEGAIKQKEEGKKGGREAPDSFQR